MKRLLTLSALFPIMAFALNAPVVTITSVVTENTVQITLDWEEVTGADEYCVYGGSDPFGESELIECLDQPPFVGSYAVQDNLFFRL